MRSEKSGRRSAPPQTPKRCSSRFAQKTLRFRQLAESGFFFTETPITSLEVPGHYRWPDQQQFVIRVKPINADGIYIADNAAFDRERGEAGLRARACTIVPISEYRGGFTQPLILVRRELSFDEVEVVSGPHPYGYG